MKLAKRPYKRRSIWKLALVYLLILLTVIAYSSYKWVSEYTKELHKVEEASSIFIEPKE